MRCDVCKKRFRVRKEDVYSIQEEPTIAQMLTQGKTKLMDCVDCPNCGCQVILKTRIPKAPAPTSDELEQAFRQGYDKGYKDGKSE